MDSGLRRNDGVRHGSRATARKQSAARHSVIPAKPGSILIFMTRPHSKWIPAFAGMTDSRAAVDQEHDVAQ
jgi:hypothetical protein